MFLTGEEAAFIRQAPCACPGVLAWIRQNGGPLGAAVLAQAARDGTAVGHAEYDASRDAATRRMRRKIAAFPSGKTFSSWRAGESSRVGLPRVSQHARLRRRRPVSSCNACDSIAPPTNQRTHRARKRIMTLLAHTRAGAGEPLVLLHGLGSSRASWEPIMPALSRRFDVLAFDLPGFGESDLLPDAVEPTPATLAAAVADTLHELDIVAPHVVGNSLGGWVALELAATDEVSSLTLLSPAGLWRANTPLYCRISLRTSRVLARFLGRGLRAVVRTRIGRLVVFAQTTGHPTRMSPAEARSAISAIGKARGFRATLHATLHRRYQATSPLHAPVTVCFGSRDRILPRRQARHLDELPAHTTTAELPGAGHVPMSDDPAAVALVITRGAGTGAVLSAAPRPPHRHLSVRGGLAPATS